ncbi:MAG: tryptophan-rich sensory protein [Micrococcales bacterium]|nr:tryptophan-rich sensory protein [Micrococcales bacterium]
MTTSATPSPSAPSGALRARQIAVTAAGIFCVIGTLYGTGAIGTRVEESAGGRLAADATLIAPAGPAFSIWSVIYLGLAAYTIWQWRTANADTDRHRATAGLAAASMVLNAAWLLVTQQGWLEVSVGVIVALLLVLAVLARRLHERPARSAIERVLVDATFGLYLGWVCVAVCANIAATLVGRGVPATGAGPTIATVVVLAVVALVAWFLAAALDGNWFATAGVVWGLAWVAAGRFGDEPPSAVVGLASILVAVVALFGAWSAAHRPARDLLTPATS